MSSIILRNFCDWAVGLSARFYRFTGPDALNVDANRLSNLFSDPLRCLSAGNDLIYCLTRDIEFSGQRRLRDSGPDHGDPYIVRAHSGRFQVYRSRFHFFWPPVKFDVENGLHLINDVVKIKMMHQLKNIYLHNKITQASNIIIILQFNRLTILFALLLRITDAEKKMYLYGKTY